MEMFIVSTCPLEQVPPIIAPFSSAAIHADPAFNAPSLHLHTPSQNANG
uniref:Uncharacterized protein n=1 Tax=Meloidogyne enterolobii TaxID=390850 RepID=A0A6V7VCF5_MELEN|nr:unnamed protein product [Meloidogyne enterolobii]